MKYSPTYDDERQTIQLAAVEYQPRHLRAPGVHRNTSVWPKVRNAALAGAYAIITALAISLGSAPASSSAAMTALPTPPRPVVDLNLPVGQPPVIPLPSDPAPQPTATTQVPQRDYAPPQAPAPVPAPSPTPTPTPSGSPTPGPTQTAPTSTQTGGTQPTVDPSASPSPDPSQSPSATPSTDPSATPSPTPTDTTTATPTPTDTTTPTPGPTP